MKFIKKDFVETDENKMFRVLDKHGKLINPKYKQDVSNDTLVKAYEYMVLSRKQDEYMLQLQRQGRMLTFAPNFGEEALQVATAAALKKEDWFIPAFRSNAAMLFLGVPLKHQLIYWNGNEKGSKIPENVNVLPVNIPIATQCSHAIGVGYGMKLKKVKGVVINFIGNGGTAEGEFYEAMNIASIHKLPVVFCVNNNRWAISTRNSHEVGSKTIAAKGMAAGMPGVIVDGNDLLASYDVIKEAVEFARTNGPVLVEFITWREGPHTTSDNPKVYRTSEEEQKALEWEPFHRIEQYLQDKKILSAKQIQKLKDQKLELVKKEYQNSLKELDVTIDEVFDYNYEKLTEELVEQKAEAKKYFESEGK